MPYFMESSLKEIGEMFPELKRTPNAPPDLVKLLTVPTDSAALKKVEELDHEAKRRWRRKMVMADRADWQAEPEIERCSASLRLSWRARGLAEAAAHFRGHFPVQNQPQYRPVPLNTA